jgi:hypothetical protein
MALQADCTTSGTLGGRNVQLKRDAALSTCRHDDKQVRQLLHDVLHELAAVEESTTIDSAAVRFSLP